MLDNDGVYEEMLTCFLSRHMHSKDHRPVLRITDNVTVTFGVTLNQIVDVVCTDNPFYIILLSYQPWHVKKLVGLSS